MRLHAIVPCRDAEAYVKRCVDSFLAYPGPELEVVTPGDASADGTGALLDALAERQPCLHLVRFGAAGGPGNARNIALGHPTDHELRDAILGNHGVRTTSNAGAWR